jgi:hypothetical protein
VFAAAGARGPSPLGADWGIYAGARAAVTSAGVALRVSPRTAVVCKYVQILMQAALADTVDEAAAAAAAAGGGARGSAGATAVTAVVPRLCPTLRNELLWTVLEVLNTPIVE